ncbi:MAG: type II secretion system F family protein [Nocardioidaceae bacterium]|nr:type II secretion system F family protein [Nocardioidaceae bacterium]
MSAAATGGVLGALAGIGAALVLLYVPLARPPRLSDRVLPYVRDVAPASVSLPAGSAGLSRTLAGVFGPTLHGAGELVGRVLGGSTDVRRRLSRSGSSLGVEQFRVEQVLWGITAGMSTAGLGLVAALAGRLAVVPLLAAVLSAFAVGLLFRDQQLSAAVRERERRMVLEFPAIADLLALAVAAGEGPVTALDRASRVARGDLPTELGRLLGEVRTGTPVALALDRLAARTGVTVLARFAATLAVAIERGTPLVDVLHAQAADVREAGRRALVETGARKEVLMMVPVVFLILPVIVVFAFYPGVVGLQLATP